MRESSDDEIKTVNTKKNYALLIPDDVATHQSMYSRKINLYLKGFSIAHTTVYNKK